MYLIMVFDVMSDRPTEQRLCRSEIELRGITLMFRREYPDAERFKIVFVPVVLSPY